MYGCIGVPLYNAFFILALGLLDFSPEEIRLEAYTANAKGNADIYVRIASHSIFYTHTPYM